MRSAIFVIILAWIMPTGALAQEPMQAAPQVAQPREMSVGEMLEQALAYREEGQAYANVGNDRDSRVSFARAIERLAKIIEVDPTNIEATLQMAEISLMRDDPHQGRKFFKRVTDIEGNNFRANLGLGQFYVVSRLWRQAIYHLEIASRVAPEDRIVETLILLAAAYREASQINDAQETIQRAVTLDEQLAGNDPMKLHPNAARIFIGILSMKQEFAASVAACDILIRMTEARVRRNSYDANMLSEYVSAFDMRVDALRALHNSLHLKDARNQATAEPIPGKEAEIAGVLAEIVKTRTQQIPIKSTLSLLEVVPLAKKAVELQPQSEAALWMLAQVCVATNLYGDAQAALEQLVNLAPGKPEYAQELQRVRNVIANAQARAQQPLPQQQP